MRDDRGMRGVLPAIRRGLASSLVVALCACAANSPRSEAATSQAPRTDDPPSQAGEGVSGVWQGVSVANCEGDPSDPGRCNAEQKIILTMFQQGNAITGYYKCAFGNQLCRHLDETGPIRDGTLKHTRLTFRVMLEDGSMCLFTGRPAANEFEGGYECLQGGGIIEQGIFQTRRNY
jgi:hypothetical protein